MITYNIIKSKLKMSIYINCPYCDNMLEISAIKCGIILHAFNSKTGKQLGAHAKQSTIDKVKNKGLLIGCGGRFKIDKKEYKKGRILLIKKD
jgi:hypothetical protein